MHLAHRGRPVAEAGTRFRVEQEGQLTTRALMPWSTMRAAHVFPVWHHRTMAEVRITVRARPGSSRSRVGGTYGDPPQLVVAVNAPPVDGAANDAVLAALADALGLRPRQVTIVGGHTARTKVVAIDVPDADVGTLRATIDGLLR